MKEYLTLQDFAKRIIVSDQTARRILNAGQIPYRKMGRQYRILVSDYKDFQQNKRSLSPSYIRQENEADKVGTGNSQQKDSATESV
ncbi:MAG: hypothetical protein A2020_16445 [Lentisphaerae bacterium GWF2_45_14]|nr:MAG: hypothetical protein A2020_16445 [Lentisphaerae bacterium GWF2_45_14]